MKGKVKAPKKTTWTGIGSINKEGKQILRIMTEKDAEDWMRKTGKAVFKKLTVKELRELDQDK